MEELINRRVKAIYSDGGREFAIRGELLSVDDLTLSIRGDRDDKVVILGKRTLVLLREAQK